MKASQGAPTILVVEDHSDSRTLLSAWLRAKGYKVVEARTGKEGLLQANRVRPDLILMDLTLPELDGVEATRQIRTRHLLSQTPIFAISSYATREAGTRTRPMSGRAPSGCSRPRAATTMRAFWS